MKINTISNTIVFIINGKTYKNKYIVHGDLVKLQLIQLFLMYNLNVNSQLTNKHCLITKILCKILPPYFHGLFLIYFSSDSIQYRRGNRRKSDTGRRRVPVFVETLCQNTSDDAYGQKLLWRREIQRWHYKRSGLVSS